MNALLGSSFTPALPRTPARARAVPRLVALPLAAGAAALVIGCPAPPLADVSPIATSVETEHIAHARVEKIDLLFVIDNSRSMADKQEILKEAVPKLVDRLVAPRCVGADGVVDPTQKTPCPDGMSPEFTPVRDMHIAVITSSLGMQGGLDYCKEGGHNDDKAWLLPAVRENISGPDFLSWKPGVNADDLSSDFRDLVVEAGEDGCGFEAPLEAWYRFLVDPEPSTQTARVPCNSDDKWNNCTEPQGIDEELLRQRAEFLRPDSLLAIVQLTDEEDCSINQKGIGHWALSHRDDGVRPASAECASNPNDPCCHSCGVVRPAECGGDSGCQTSPWVADGLDIRCWDQKRRFGIEYTYPTTRYSDALTKKELRNRAGEMIRNPLLDRRDGSFVFLAGIVGVPWQDLVADPTAAGLKYLKASELRGQGRWEWMLGIPEGSPAGTAPVPPADPFMIQSVEVRPGEHPLTADQPRTQGNPINGGDSPGRLQYACISDKLVPQDCDAPGAPSNCECKGSPDNPKCDGSILTKASANPGTRLLQVLKDFAAGQHSDAEDNAIAASICTKQIDDPNSDSFGYTPAVDTLVDRLKAKLQGACLARELEVALDGRVPCRVIQATPRADSAECACAVDVDPEFLPIYQAKVKELEQCQGDAATCSDGYCFCELEQLYEAGNQCQSVVQEDAVTEVGWCYLNGKGDTKPVLDSLGCKDAVNPQSLRVVGSNAPGTLSFVSCILQNGS